MIPPKISEQVIQLIQQSLSGLEAENPKVDFKEKWYDLKDKRGISEFIKDTSAIANTFGLEGLIIIGYDDKTKTFTDASFSHCGLRDSADLYSLIVRHVSDAFEINYYETEYEKNILGVLHIPPSLHKPHLIRNYQTFDKNGLIKSEVEQRIFVRKNTGTFPATKYDLELMYYDRKNIIPEYELHVTIDLKIPDIGPSRHLQNGKYHCIGVTASINFTFENTGRRPLSFKFLELTMALYEDSGASEKISFRSKSLLSPDWFHGGVLKSQEIRLARINLESLSFSGWGIESATNKVNEFKSQGKDLIIKDFLVHTTNNVTIIPRVIIA
ncbi:AlbA family DNA-binding domain-containing protein [Chitinophaga niabensis]|uniref:Putative DNA-binding domain-containing protein n=1 Tax=Chitinophaga niabensis TaxID=536979 RepID=A0A1N6KB48_9BACT|nr:ATP-binding protein [Chitinophaga niabensis]SIO53673.1 Putative DNA-binding domain-containing protein [Chitinophaga niabensis]